MQRKVRSRCVHDFGTGKGNAAAQCQLPTNSAAKHAFALKVSTAQPHSLCKYQSHAHTPRSDFPLHIDIKNIYQICMEK